MDSVTQVDARPNRTALRRRTAEDLRAQALSPSTRRVYKNHIRRWLAWWGGRGGGPTGEDVAEFLLWVRDVRGLSVASVVSHLSALTWFLEIAASRAGDDRRSPTRSPEVRALMRGMSREADPPRQAPALLPAAYNAIRDRLERELARPTHARRRNSVLLDIAMLSTMYDCGLRVSELAALEWGDIERWPDGTGRLHIRRSKADQAGQGATVFATERTMDDLAALRAESPTRPFPRTHQRLQARIRRMAEAVGLIGFTVHSGRVGVARRLRTNGAPDSVIMKQGRWKTPTMIATYTRGEEVAEVGRYL